MFKHVHLQRTLSPYAILSHILNPQALHPRKLKIRFIHFLVPGKL